MNHDYRMALQHRATVHGATRPPLSSCGKTDVTDRQAWLPRNGSSSVPSWHRIAQIHCFAFAVSYELAEAMARVSHLGYRYYQVEGYELLFRRWILPYEGGRALSVPLVS